MAYYGLSNPWIAKLDPETSKYLEGFKCGTAVGTEVNPQYNESKLYGDNVLQESLKEFKYADVTLTTTSMPIEAANVVFGHTIDKTKKSIVYNASDEANYVGYGFFASEMINGKATYIAVVLPKVKFSEGTESYTTKGDSIEFKTPSLSGNAMADATGNWKKKQTFDTEAEAIAYIKKELNITDEAA